MSTGSLEQLPFAIAHRGGNECYTENTIEAFADATELGYTRLETDVQVDADGELIVVHGQTMDRIDHGDYVHVNGTAFVISALRKVDREAMRTDGIYIPALQEVLDVAESAYWNIDVKKPHVIDPLLHVLKNRKMFPRVCLGSYDKASIEKVRALSPEGTQTALVESELIELYMASLDPGTRIELPDRSRAQVPTWFEGTEVTTERFITAAHEHEIPVDVWTVNDPSEVKKLVELGVDGIFSDKLRMLKDKLIELRMWPTVST